MMGGLRSHRPVDRSPSPPIRMDRHELLSVKEFVSCALQEVPRIMCSSALGRGLGWQCGDCVVGTSTGAQVLVWTSSQVNCALPMGVPRTLMPSACQTSGPSWHITKSTPPRCHTLVFPWCHKSPIQESTCLLSMLKGDCDQNTLNNDGKQKRHQSAPPLSCPRHPTTCALRTQL